MAFQAVHGYERTDENKMVSKELLDHALSDQSTNIAVAKITAVGMLVSNKKIVLPKTTYWKNYAEQGLIVGRNPYSAKRLQFVDKSDIVYSDFLNMVEVFQYSLTGYYE